MFTPNKLKYILHHFKLLFGFDAETLISYGFNSKSKIQINNSGSSFFDGNSPLPRKKTAIKWKDSEIPFLFTEERKEILEIRDGIAYINYDIISNAFFYLSGWQEYFNEKKDVHGRFPWKESIQYELKISGIPVVNYYFDILKTAVETVTGKKLNVDLWNGNPPFVSFISHDIDKCKSAWKEGVLGELGKGNFFSPYGLFMEKIFGNDAWFNFDELQEVDNHFIVKPTYFFIGRYGKENGIWNADYRIERDDMQTVLHDLSISGCEVGIHGSFGTHLDPDKLKNEMVKINRDIYGNRFHFLKFDAQKSPGVLEKAGVQYDSTLGFAEQPGFRHGFCFPFFLYDLTDDRMTNVLEVPLTVMDATLLEKKYLGLTPGEALPFVIKIISEIKKFNGCFTLLWHNNTISEFKYSGWRKVYEGILEYISAQNTVFLSGRDIYEAVSRRGDRH
ncbi:MAG: polysaccharide deacetylase family protein [Bacteroidetes bacterium]|nr:polysaccharide deacetylase family protein [Bacteroidota bacterium]